MSYLEMASATLPDMQKGIVSLWFRDIRKAAPPLPTPWPSGLWTPGTDSMLPPDTVGMINSGAYQRNIFYWDAYGMPISVFGISLGLLGPATVCIPSPPPFVTNDMHMMLTFGDPDQTYDYCSWQLQTSGAIDAVHYIPQLITGPQWSAPDWPPPYAPYFVNEGKFKPLTLSLGSPVSRPDYVPQSFIGVDANGYLTICLQTNTKAEYKGWAFQLDKITEISATLSYLDDPDLETAGTWVHVPGYWDGYEF